MRLAYQFQGKTVKDQGWEAGGGIPCRPNPAATLLVNKDMTVAHQLHRN